MLSPHGRPLGLPFLFAGMEAVVHLAQSLTGDVRVHLSGADTGMTEKFLNHAQVGAVLEQVRGETVPQHVWCDVALDASQVAPFLDARPQCHCSKCRASAREKYIARTLAGFG